MKARGRTCLALGAASLLACGSGPSSAPGPDAAADGSPADAVAPEDSGSCFPYCGTGREAGGGGDDGGASDDGSTDGGMSCTQLKALYESLLAAAQACNPQIQGQCVATTNGPCCPVTVGVDDRSAIDNFDQAVAMYKAQCSPDCSMSICQPAPSNACEPLGTKGLCR